MVFFLRLAAAPPAGSFDAAYRLLCQTLEAVEDEFSGVPNNPTRWQADGRLYPPQQDTSFEVPGSPEVTGFRSRAHKTYIGRNGAIEIRSAFDGTVVFEKPGSDGGSLWS